MLHVRLFVRPFLNSVLSVVVAAQGSLAFAAAGSQIDETVKDVTSQFTGKKMAGSKAAFCLAIENGPIKGYNEDQLVRTASVTKTMTTFWAVEQLGPNFQYSSKIYYQASNHELHIEGQRDPFFDRDRIFTLLADLNRRGITHLDRLTVDSNFWFWPDATEIRYLGGAGYDRKAYSHPKKSAFRQRRRHAMLSPQVSTREPASIFSLGNKPFKLFVEAETHTDQTLAGKPDKIMIYLAAAMNTDRWNDGLKSRYQRARKLNPGLNLPDQVKMSIDKIDIVLPTANPLSGKPGVAKFEIKSAPIKNFLKLMNIWSINPWAEEIFFSLGGKARFQSFMQAKYGYGERVADMNSGSGVNLHGANRDDSMLSCSTVVSMIRTMNLDLESKYKMNLSDVLSVPGKDGGTWHDETDSLIVKTGTLNHPTPAKNLAGAAETTSGEVYFGIFVDRRGGKIGTVRTLLTHFQRHFRPVKVKESPYIFSPFSSYTHMTELSTLPSPRQPAPPPVSATAIILKARL